MKLTIDDIKRKTKPIFEEYGVKKAILFGSYAKGLATDNIDVDILVDSRCYGFKFFGILEKITCVLKKDIDLIDVIDVKKSSITEKEILQTGIVIYEH